MMVYAPAMDGKQMIRHFLQVSGLLPGCYGYQRAVFDNKRFNVAFVNIFPPQVHEILVAI